MTDQPDHRAEAEKWLQFAGTLQQGGGYIETATYALIGIGHALLAFTDDGGWEGIPPVDISLPSSAHTTGAGMHTPKPTDQQTHR
jgi:hypothetical protein